MRRWIVVIASVIVSAIFLYFVLRDVPLADVGARFAEADLLWLGVSFVLGFGAIWTRAVRWRGLVNDRLTLRDAFYITAITFLVNQLPLRAGEVARSWLASRRGVPFMTAATSIIVERLLDTLTVVLMILFAITQLPDIPQQAADAATFFGVAGVFGFVILLAVARFPDFARNILHRVERILPILSRLPLATLLEHTIDGLKPLTDLRRFIHVLIWTVIAWAFSVVMVYTLHLALNITDVNLTLSSLLGVALASLSIAIPVTVAAIGPFEAAIRLTGDIVGMDDISAISLGFLFHGMTVLVYVFWGVIGLLAMGVTLGDVLQSGDKKPADATERPPA